jgi:hypothetical protein
MKFAVLFTVVIAANVFANPMGRSDYRRAPVALEIPFFNDTQAIEVTIHCKEVPE